MISTFWTFDLPHWSLALQALSFQFLSVLPAASLTKSGTGAFCIIADSPMNSSMPIAMKCFWTSGSMNMEYVALAKSSALTLASSTTCAASCAASLPADATSMTPSFWRTMIFSMRSLFLATKSWNSSSVPAMVSPS